MSHDRLRPGASAGQVVVIGGGFAGLSAATALAERGVAVLILESRPALGGRATAFTDPATGERVDNGQHVLIGGYHETFRFLRRIGSERHVFLQDRLAIAVVDRDGRGSRLSCPPLPAPLHLAAGLMRWDALRWRDKFSALRIGPPEGGPHKEEESGGHLQVVPPSSRGGHLQVAPSSSRGGHLQVARNETVRQYLERRGQTPRLIELLWEPLAVAALNQSIDTAAAAPFVEVIRRMFSTSRRDSSLGLPLVPLDELYALPARRYVEARQGSVRTNAPARIHVHDGVFVSVRGEELQPRAVVCTAPWYALSETFDGRPLPLEPTLRAADETASSPIVTVNVWFDRPVGNDLFVGLPGRSMQWLFDKRRLFGATSSHVSLVSSGASALVGLSNEEIRGIALAEVTSALPDARAAGVTRVVVVRERRATFSVAPGQPPRPGVRTDVPGLFLAGDWIDTGLPATIESAVMSGHEAAAAVLEFLAA